MSLLKVVIWMNMPSHHQSAFFDALYNHGQIDIEVRYFDKLSNKRKLLGWQSELKLPDYQKYISTQEIIDNFPTLNDCKDRIHIVPGFSHPFLKFLLEKLIINKIKWVHWSEKSGKPFTRLLNYNYTLINFLKPIYFLKNGYYQHAKNINKYALGAFAISKLAKNDFKRWGVKSDKIRILNYAIQGLVKEDQNPLKELIDNETKIFLYCGVLTKHKGVGVLLKAFVQINNNNNNKWKLVLLGNDEANGKYQQWVINRKLENKVHFIGSVSINQMNLFMSRADVFVLPTLFDGWGMVLNEAASLGKPLISTDQCGAACHLINNGINGFIIKANSIKSLVLSMQYYINNDGKLDEHALESKNIFNKNLPLQNAELFYKHLSYLNKK